MTFDKSDIIEALKNVCAIKFIKSDGTERDMICTQNLEKIDIVYESKTNHKTKNDDIITVWDMEKNNFRCFNIQSLVMIEELEN